MKRRTMLSWMFRLIAVWTLTIIAGRVFATDDTDTDDTPVPPTVAERSPLVQVYAGESFFEGPTWDPKSGKLYFISFAGAKTQILRLERPGRVGVWLDGSEGVNGTFLAVNGRMLGAQAFGLGSLALDFRSLPLDFRSLPFGFDFQPFGLGFLPLLGGFHLQARGFLLALAFGLLGQNGFFQGQQRRVVGHGLQPLLDVHQTHVQRAFLASLLGPFQELLGL